MKVSTQPALFVVHGTMGIYPFVRTYRDDSVERSRLLLEMVHCYQIKSDSNDFSLSPFSAILSSFSSPQQKQFLLSTAAVSLSESFCSTLTHFDINFARVLATYILCTYRVINIEYAPLRWCITSWNKDSKKRRKVMNWLESMGWNKKL